MKTISQSKFWNNKKIIKEFASYGTPEHWKSFLLNYSEPSKVRLLDIGCGGGRNVTFAASLGFDVYACDLHQGMVQRTRRVLSRYFQRRELSKRVIRAGFEDLPYTSKSFDIVILSGVLHNTARIDEYKKGIEEVSRILDDKGVLCFNVFYYKSKNTALRGSHSKRHVFYTADGLAMVLLPKTTILKLFRLNNIVPAQKIFYYQSKVGKGERNVLRGVFKKSEIKRS